MIREYWVRGQRKTVEEIENVVAVRWRDGAGARVARAAFGPEVPDSVTGLDSATAEAFAKAQWLFVQPPLPSRIATASASASEADADAVGKLVRRASGRFAVITRRVNVQLRPELSEPEVQAALSARGLLVRTRLRFAPNLFEVDAAADSDALSTSAALQADSRFVLAEPSFIEHVPVREASAPADPRFPEQWQWSNTGQDGGIAGADVRAESAWLTTRGAGVRVAVIDNGFNAGHEDLAAGIGASSGYFRSAGAEPAVFVQGTAGMPNSDHGTFCAGIVGARQNNERGGSGAAPECELMLIACLGDQVGSQTTLARAVAYAADPTTEQPDAKGGGADVLVSSLGPNGAAWDLSATLTLALEFAATSGRSGRGLSIFWAASNGRNVDVLEDEVVSHPDVIAVVRSTRRDLEDNAARGAAVDLIAPGVDVVSTTGDGRYGSSTGTSFAAPCAAGCAALALSVKPDLTRDALRRIMFESADRIGGVEYDAEGHNDDYGFGRVNAARAVELAGSHVVSPDV